MPVVACWDGGAVVDVVPESGAGRLSIPSADALADNVLNLLADTDRLALTRLVGEAWRARLAPDHVAQVCEGWYVMPSPERLRILTVTHNYPRFAGDAAGAFVARIAQGAAARGHEVKVIAPHTPGTTVVEHGNGVELHRFRYTGGARAPRLHWRPAPGHAAVPPGRSGLSRFSPGIPSGVRRAVRRFEPHLIHAHWWFPGGWFAAKGGVPYLITCHGSDVRLLERTWLRGLPPLSFAARHG